MCLAIVKPGGVFIPFKHLEEGFKSNRDGAGFAYASKGELIMKKGFFTFEAFWDEYKTLVGAKPALIHFRIATSGEKDAFNCHPWMVENGDGAVIHNGIIQIESSKEKSDTGHFVDDIFDPMLKGGLDPLSKSAIWAVEKMIGFGNKVAYLHKSGRCVIYNENASTAHWHEKIWYSNRSYESWTSSWTGGDKSNKKDKHKRNAHGYWKNGVFTPYETNHSGYHPNNKMEDDKKEKVAIPKPDTVEGFENESRSATIGGKYGFGFRWVPDYGWLPINALGFAIWHNPKTKQNHFFSKEDAEKKTIEEDAEVVKVVNPEGKIDLQNLTKGTCPYCRVDFNFPGDLDIDFFGGKNHYQCSLCHHIMSERELAPWREAAREELNVRIEKQMELDEQKLIEYYEQGGYIPSGE